MLQDKVSTEDKLRWCAHGAKLENDFVANIAPKCPNFSFSINPKKKIDIYAPDLLVNGELADLKTQNTPFFKAQDLFGIPSDFAVTFNVKDYNRYTQLYPDIKIVYWVQWKQTEWIHPHTQQIYRATPVHGVWLTTAKQICQFVESGAAKHDYQRRQNDTKGNAKDSFCFDLRQMVLLWQQERQLYAVNFDDGSSLSVVENNPIEGEIDNEVIAAVKSIKQELKAEVIGSEKKVL